MASETPSRRSRSLSLLAIVGLLGLAASLAAPTVAAETCAAEDDLQLSLRPHSLQDPLVAPLVSLTVLGMTLPSPEENCQGPCPGRPAVVAWADPDAVGSSDPLVHLGLCRLPEPVGRAIVEVGGDGVPFLHL